MWLIRNQYIFETATDTNMKQYENSMETRKAYLEMFDVCFISFPANVNAIFEFFTMDTASTLATPCEIRSRSSRRDCGSGDWYTRSFTYPHRHNVRGCRGLRNGSCLSHPSLFVLPTPFYFDSDRGATRGSYATVDVPSENLMRFLTVFHVCIYNCIEYTQISYGPNTIYNSCVCIFFPAYLLSGLPDSLP
jgi:hypothetical protein